MQIEGLLGSFLKAWEGCSDVQSEGVGAGLFEIIDSACVAGSCNDFVSPPQCLEGQGLAEAGGAAGYDPDFRHGDRL